MGMGGPTGEEGTKGRGKGERGRQQVKGSSDRECADSRAARSPMSCRSCGGFAFYLCLLSL